jgi:protein-ribulosamine 3-kinase
VTELPAGLQNAVGEVLLSVGDQLPLNRITPVGGGCINNAMRLDTAQASYLLKWNLNPLPGLFLVERRGLELLRSTRTIRVPEPYDARDAQGSIPAFILMEWLEGSPGKTTIDQELLGRQMAEMHRAGISPHMPAAYGLDHDNYVGSTPQENGWNTNWVSFFAQNRLVPQMKLALLRGRLPDERRRRLERVIERLGELLGDIERRPALLHGDLWGGNIMAGPDGPALIDPAVYYGDREAELAFTELFGGFSSRFYQAYAEAWRIEQGYKNRKDIYNLYHLLNHLNIFGEMYGSPLDQILRHYS